MNRRGDTLRANLCWLFVLAAAAAAGWLDEPAVVRENLIAIRRAGADQIITYHARDALRGKWL